MINDEALDSGIDSLSKELFGEAPFMTFQVSFLMDGYSVDKLVELAEQIEERWLDEETKTRAAILGQAFIILARDELAAATTNKKDATDGDLSMFEATAIDVLDSWQHLGFTPKGNIALLSVYSLDELGEVYSGTYSAVFSIVSEDVYKEGLKAMDEEDLLTSVKLPLV